MEEVTTKARVKDTLTQLSPHLVSVLANRVGHDVRTGVELRDSLE